MKSRRGGLDFRSLKEFGAVKFRQKPYEFHCHGMTAELASHELEGWCDVNVLTVVSV